MSLKNAQLPVAFATTDPVAPRTAGLATMNLTVAESHQGQFTSQAHPYPLLSSPRLPYHTLPPTSGGMLPLTNSTLGSFRVSLTIFIDYHCYLHPLLVTILAERNYDGDPNPVCLGTPAFVWDGVELMDLLWI